jgi:hypothetical protein
MKLIPIARIRAMSVPDIVQFATANACAAATTFLNVAKAIVALNGDVKSIEAALLDSGVPTARAKNLLKNAGQAVSVWDSTVALGLADEDWFDQLTYGDFVTVNRTLKKAVVDGLKGSQHLADAGVFKMNATQAIVWCEAFLSPPIAPVTPAPTASAPSTPPPTAEAPPTPATPPATVEAPTGKLKPLGDSVMEKLEALEKSVLGLIDVSDEVTVERVMSRLAVMRTATTMARDKRFPAKAPVDTSSLQELATRAVA